MTTQQIHEAALTQGIVPQALQAVTAKVQAHFAVVNNEGKQPFAPP